MDKARKLVKGIKQFLGSLDDGNDFFRPMKYFLVIGGIHLPTQDPFYRRLFVCYRILVGIQFFVWADRLYVALFEWKARGDLVAVSAFFLAELTILMQNGLIWIHLEKLKEVSTFLGRQLNDNRTGRRDKSYRLLRWIALGMEVVVFVDQILFVVFGLHRDRIYCTPANLSRLDWRMKLFFDVSNASNQFVYCSLYVAHVTILNSLLMAFEVVLEEMVVGFEEIFERIDRKLNEVFDKDKRLRKQPKLREAFKEPLFWNILEKELNLVIMRHSELLEQLGTLGGCFKMSFLFLFYMDIVVLSCGSFYILGQGLTYNTVILVSYVIGNLLQFYWFCWLVDNLNYTNGQIGSAAYNLDWHQRLQKAPSSTKIYRKIRTTWITVMTKSQQNLGITCGGLFEMSAEAFHNLMKMIYSFLMFLLNTAA